MPLVVPVTLITWERISYEETNKHGIDRKLGLQKCHKLRHIMTWSSSQSQFWASASATGWLVSPPIHMVKSLPTMWLEMGLRKRKLKSNEVIRGEAWHDRISAYKKKHHRALSLSLCFFLSFLVHTKKRSSEHTRRRPLSTSQEKRPQKETYLSDTLTLDFPVSRTMRKKFLWFKPPSLWYFVMAA